MPEDILDPEMEQRGEAAPIPMQAPVAPQAPAAPQLTPIQQQFLQSLRALPPRAVPFSGGGEPGLQGFSAPGYATGYQPAQSFDDPAYQEKLFEWEQEVRRTAEAARAEQAIQSGIRYIYQRRYDEDLKSGMPEPKAFSRMMLGIAMHGPKTDPIKAYQAFRSHPAPTGRMIQIGTNQVPGVNETDRFGAQRFRQVTLPLPTGPVQGLPVLNPGGTTNANYLALPSASGRGFTHLLVKPGTGTLSPLQQTEKADQAKLYKEAADVLRQEGAKTPHWYSRGPDKEKVAKAIKEFQSASNALLRLSPQAVPSNGSTNRIRVISPDGKAGTVSEANLEEALKAGYKRQ